MKTETNSINPVYQIVTDRILSMLEAGTVPWRKPWSGGKSGGLPVNFHSHRPYSGVNVWMLYGSRWSSKHWLTFKQALDLGGNVRKGEKGTPIVFTKQLPLKQVEVETENGPEKMIDGRSGARMLKYFTVFNLDQCEGIKDTEPVITYDHDPIEEAERVIAGYHGPEIFHGGGRACYSRDLDRVLIPDRNRFDTAESYYSTMFHELAHSTGHKSRLNRLLPESSFGNEAYGKEELVAEMASAFIACKTGIKDTTLDNSAAYIQAWIETIKKDSKLVIQAASAAQKAANLILGESAE